MGTDGVGGESARIDLRGELMSNPLFTAVLNSQSPRYSDWRHVLGHDSVPIKSPQVAKANLGDELDVEVYQLDIEALSPEQRDRLVNFVALKFGVAPVKVEEQLESIGFPIRAVDVTVGYSMRAFM